MNQQENAIIVIYFYIYHTLLSYIYILVWSEKKFGVSKNNYDRKLPNSRYTRKLMINLSERLFFLIY